MYKYLIGEKQPVKSDQFFGGNQYFSPTNNFTRLKIKFDQKFLSVTFSPEQNQITKMLKKNYRIHYTIIYLSGIVSPPR